jgi:hypothetical protein
MMHATPQYSSVNPEPSPMYGQVIIPPHTYNWASVLQPIYKRLPPEDIVRLKAGDELIVVVLAVDPKTPNDVAHIVCLYTWALKNILNRSLQHPEDWTSVVDDAICNSHTFLCEDRPFLEFVC